MKNLKRKKENNYLLSCQILALKGILVLPAMKMKAFK